MRWRVSAHKNSAFSKSVGAKARIERKLGGTEILRLVDHHASIARFGMLVEVLRNRIANGAEGRPMLFLQQTPHPIEHLPKLLTLAALQGHLPPDALNLQVGLQVAHLPRVNYRLPFGAHEGEVVRRVHLTNRLLKQRVLCFRINDGFCAVQSLL
jgi:hypothetical protein